MNFKATLLKTVISLIIGLIGGFVYWELNFKFGGYYPLTNWVISGIVIVILVYIIWSLFQDKK